MATAALIVIGNEVLSGRTRDANTQMIAQGLVQQGVTLAEVRVIPDVSAVIVATLNALRPIYDFIFTTGGIGPTHDDITAQAVADAFARPLEIDERARALLTRHYGADRLNDARLKMAYVPKGAVLIDNPVSSAPGFRVDNVYVLPGVPDIARAMFDGIKHELAGGAVVLSRTVSVHLSEGDIAADLTAVQNRHTDVEIGSYPFFRGGKLGTSLVLRSADEAALETAQADTLTMIHAHGGTVVED